MKTYILILLFLAFYSTSLKGQKYFSKNGHIHFTSEAPIETIEADNYNAFAVFDGSTGVFEFSVLIKGFKFEKALMQEHFNEDYLESDIYPKSIFKGKITKMGNIHFDKDQTFNINVTGLLTIRDITKELSCPAKLTVKGGVMSAFATFDITISDYGIQVPKVVMSNISKKVSITVTADLRVMN